MLSVSLFFHTFSVKAALFSFTVPSLVIHVRQLLWLEQAVCLEILKMDIHNGIKLWA